jgi:hypothetical protein
MLWVFVHPDGECGIEGETFVARGTLRTLGFLGVGALGLLVAACADSGSGFGDPGPIALPSGSSCGSIQTELNRLLGRGVQGNIERHKAGKALTPAAKTDVDRYNSLLNQYLGARCHV